jgi:ribokinase
MSAPRITVVGSVNLDLVATAQRLPSPGETVTGATLSRHPGGKGANQALSARRLGAEVRLVGRVGADAMADEALALLRAAHVDLSGCPSDFRQPTGVALIAVGQGGENQIVVAPGANAAFAPDLLSGPIDGALICQLELPVETVARAVSLATGFVCLNLAPAMDVPAAMLERADLIVVNEGEAAFYDSALDAVGGLVAITLGPKGARLFRGENLLAEVAPPSVVAVDTTGAGDCFVAALTVAILENRPLGDALAFACTASALAVTRHGAQPSLPTRAEVDARMRS